MSHYLVELYTPTAKWRALPAEGRKAFLDGLVAGLGDLASRGIEALTLSEVIAGIDHDAGYRFLAIWRFPGAEAIDAQLAELEASGWYDYFRQVNVASDTGDFAHHLASLISA